MPAKARVCYSSSLAFQTLRGPWFRALLGVASFPFIYYSLVLYSSGRFFRRARTRNNARFTPPVSNLKPVRGLDPDAYENFASFCRQDYPEYEVLFCVDGPDDPVVPVLERLRQEFPKAHIRVLFGSDRIATNDKVAKLARLVNEASYEHLIISDSDVRVKPDYLCNVIAPLRDKSIGATTCFYVSAGEGSIVDRLQSMGMISDFYASLLVAQRLDGVKFTLGPTIGTTRTYLQEFGGYESIENKPADDLWIGRLIAEHGRRVELLEYAVETVPDFNSLADLVHKRMRWLVVQRHMRPWGHLGFLFTQGLPWTLLAIALYPTAVVWIAFGGSYLALRVAMTWLIGAWGLKRPGLWKDMPLIIAWDALAFVMWLASFTRTTIRWRNADYSIVEGQLIPRPSTKTLSN